MTESSANKVIVRCIAQTTHGDETIRIQIKTDHDPDASLRDAVDQVSYILRLREAAPSVTFLSNAPPGIPYKIYTYVDLPEVRLCDVIGDSTKELSMMCSYEEPEDSKDKRVLTKFIHSIALREKDTTGESTSPHQALLTLIANIDDLLPDAHNRGTTFVEDVKALAKATGDDFPSLLPSLLLNLIRILEHAGNGAHRCCHEGVSDQKSAAGNLIHFLVDEFSAPLSLYSIHLETLVMRLMSFSDSSSGSRWAASFVPHLLKLIKKRGGLASMRSLWSDYWTALREEMDASTGEASVFIDSVRESIKQLGVEGITTAELAEIGEMIRREVEGKLGSEKKKTMRSRGFARDEGRKLKSIGELIRIGCQVLGSPFLTEVRPLLSPVCSLMAKFDWSTSILKDLSSIAPELMDCPLIRSSINRESVVPSVSSDRPIHAKNESIESNKEKYNSPLVPSRAAPPTASACKPPQSTEATKADLSTLRRSLSHEKWTIRSEALDTLIGVLRSRHENQQDFVNLMPAAIESATNSVEETKVLECMVEISSLPLSTLVPILPLIFDNCVKILSDTNPDLCFHSTLILRNILYNEWDKVAPIITIDRINKLCETLLKAARKKNDRSTPHSIEELVAQVAQWRHEANIRWTELDSFIAECVSSDDCKFALLALVVIQRAPCVVITADATTTDELKKLIVEAAKSGQWLASYAAMEAFDALAKESEWRENERLTEIVMDLTPVLIEAAHGELAAGGKCPIFHSFFHKENLMVMSPHLSSLLSLFQAGLNHTALSEDHGSMRAAVRLLKRKIKAHNFDSSFLSTWSADRTAFVSSLEVFDNPTVAVE